jgi:hypothetical protein
VVRFTPSSTLCSVAANAALPIPAGSDSRLVG